MAIFYTDTGSLGQLEVSGSTILSASSGNVLHVKGSGKNIFSVSGSKGSLLEISEIDSTNPEIYVISSASIDIFKILSNKVVAISGSMVITGSVGINTLAFDTISPQALLVSASTINAISGEANINTYIQLNITNNNGGAAASSDIVATNDTGNESGNYVDLGINSSGYAPGIGSANEAYLYNTGSNLLIGNITRGTNANVKLFAGNDATIFPLTITGSVIYATGSFTGSLTGALIGSASYAVSALTASYALTSEGGLTVTTQTAATYNETATSGNKLVLLNTAANNITVNLPTAVGNTATIRLKKIARQNVVTIDGNGTQTIDGGLTALLLRDDESITIMSDNSNWYIT